MTLQPPLRSDQRWTIAVEGVDDKHVFGHIAQIAGFDLREVVKEFSGIETLLGVVGEILRIENGGTVGIVLDANGHPERRWQSVVDRLSRAGVNVPSEPDPKGMVIRETDLLPRVGIWMMPDNKSLGELEDFVASMIPSDDLVWPRSVAYIDGIVNDMPCEHHRFKGKEMRAKVHAWIATREAPGFMGQAVARGDLDTDTPLCQTFIAWLNRLFTEPAPPDPA